MFRVKANLTQTIQAAAPGAVGSFNVLDLDMAVAIADTAAELRQPMILGVAARHFELARAELLTPSLLRLIERCPVPIALHLDHASPKEKNMIRKALDLGFTSIMIDASKLPLAANIQESARVVAEARPYGASVEGELGAISGEEGVADQGKGSPEKLPFTDAGEAGTYVKESGVDALAIAVGTAHGIYAAAPSISFATIEAVAAAVSVPLVLHGATGVLPDDMRRCIRLGIRKINFFSGFLQAAMDRARADAAALGNDYAALKTRIGTDWRAVARDQIALYALRQ